MAIGPELGKGSTGVRWDVMSVWMDAVYTNASFTDRLSYSVYHAYITLPPGE